ncbi:MAG: hypothetical protein ABL959_03455, partial [Pyrinomonadaceae bacterium]
MTLPDIFQPYEKLIEIDLLGEKKMVPENNTILRCFQFLSMESISYGDFCWNGDCLNCKVWVKDGEKEKAVISCRAMASPGMEIVSVSDDIEFS